MINETIVHVMYIHVAVVLASLFLSARLSSFCARLSSRPLVIFVKAASADGVRKLHTSARVDNKQGHSMLSVRALSPLSRYNIMKIAELEEIL